MTERYATGEPVQVGDVLIPLPGFAARFLNTKFRAHEADTVESLDGNGRPILAHDTHKVTGWFDVAGRFALVRRAEPEREATPAIDISAIKAGDYATVRLKVVAGVDRDGDLELSRAFAEGYNSVYIPASLVIGHEPAPQKPLAVGDRVRHKARPTSAYEILSIDGEFVWAVSRSGLRSTLRLANLERVS